MSWRSIGRWARLVAALAVAGAPTVMSVAPLHASEAHCRQSPAGHDQHPGPTPNCEAGSQGQECDIAACPTGIHCGALNNALAVTSTPSTTPPATEPVPTSPTRPLGSLTSAPPTRPPRR